VEGSDDPTETTIPPATARAKVVIDSFLNRVVMG
jgi:hypothetical protein